MRRGDNETGLVFTAAFLFSDGREVGSGQLLISLAIRHLLDPAEPIQLGKSFLGPAFAERLRGQLVIALLPQDLGDLGHPQAGRLLQ